MVIKDRAVRWGSFAAFKEACGPEAWPADPLSGQTEDINLRQAIFRG